MNIPPYLVYESPRSDLSTLTCGAPEPARPRTDYGTLIAIVGVSNSSPEDSFSMNEKIWVTRIHEEIHMYTKAFTRVRSVLGAAAVACTLFAFNVVAADNNVTIAIKVSAQGLDLSQPDGARQFYSRLQQAARVVCTHGYRVDLAPPAIPKACFEKALGDAVRSAKLPLLTQVYLETHTLREAEARGIEVPVQMAAK